jgi:uncharacterized membrane-anchored protein
MGKPRWLLGLGVTVTIALAAATALSKQKGPADPGDPAPSAPAPSAAPGAPTEAAPEFTPVAGPTKVELGHDLQLDLPEGFRYLDPPQAKKLMEKNGNFFNDNLLGVVVQGESDWLITIRYTEDGYVKDDEAAKLNAGDLLRQLHDGTEEANEERQKHGFPPIHVAGWSEPPTYQAQSHHMVWGMRLKRDNATLETVNFNTRVLGRKGYVAINLIDDSKAIDAAKPAAAAILGATTYKPGSRYQDFDPKKGDKVAEYGLAALVLGGVALKVAKVGLLAKFGAKLIALLIALKKVIVLAIAGFAAWLKRILGRDKKTSTTPVATVPPPSAAPPPSVTTRSDK